MRVAVCSSGDTLDSAVDPRFGRCACFVVVDTETLDVQAIPNPGVALAQGAGIQAAQIVTGLGASAVIAGSVGPNAFQALAAAGAPVYAAMGGTVRQAVEMLKAGQLQQLSSPTSAGRLGANPGLGQGMGRGRGAGRGRGGRHGMMGG